MNKTSRLNHLPRSRVGFLNSVLYSSDDDSGGDTATLTEIEESISQTGEAIKTVGKSVEDMKKNVDTHDTKIVEVSKSVEKIVHDLETTNKSLDTHINHVREALKQLPAGQSASSGPWATSSNDQYAVQFKSIQACEAFGLMVMGRCAADEPVRAKMKSMVESRKNELHFDAVYKALEAGDHQRGGALVPETMINEMIMNIEQHGVFEQNARKLPMPGNVLLMPKRTAGLTIYYPDENVDITASDPTTDDVQFTARLYATLTKWSNELVEDVAIDFGAWMAEEIVDAHSKARDTNGFTGAGQSTKARVNGVLNQSDVVKHILGNAIGLSATDTAKDAFGDIVYNDLIAMQGLIPTKSRANAKWYMHRHILAIIRGLVSTTGAPIVADVTKSQGQMSMLLGDPVVEVDVMPSASDSGATTDFLAYGDLRLAYGFGQRRQLRILNSIEAGFAADQTWIRSTARVAIAAMDGTQLVKGRTSTT